MENLKCDFSVTGEPGLGGYTGNAGWGNKHGARMLGEKHQQSNSCG